MKFPQALELLDEGEKITRAGWNGKDMWIAKQVPDENSKMQESYAYMKNAQGKLIPWLCSQGDLFADDWQWLHGGKSD